MVLWPWGGAAGPCRARGPAPEPPPHGAGTGGERRRGVSNQGTQAGRVEGSRRTRSPRAPLAFELYCCVCPFPPPRPFPWRLPGPAPPVPSLPRAGAARPSRGDTGAVTLLWAPGTALCPALGGEHLPAKLESYTAITYKTFINSHIILSSEGLALFFFSLSIFARGSPFF